MSEEPEEYQAGPEITPIEQRTILFYDKPLVVVRLADNRPGVVVRSLCENMQLDRLAQIRRIQRTPAIADDLVSNVVISTDGGPQRTHVLILRSVPYWLTGIDATRARAEIRDEIIRYQRECVDVLYRWAQAPQALPAPATGLIVPAESISRPVQPAHDAPLDEWRSYHLRMAAFIDWQMEIQAWRGDVDVRLVEVENRLESVEALAGLIPEILQSLPAPTITNQHQRYVQAYVRKLSEASGKHPNTIHDDLKTVFEVPRYQELLEADWEKIAQWFETQIEQAQKKKKK